MDAETENGFWNASNKRLLASDHPSLYKKSGNPIGIPLCGRLPIPTVTKYTYPLRMNAQNNLPKEALEFFRQKGRIGGKNRAANLSAKERSDQARKAVQARWAKQAKKTSKKKGMK